MSEELFVNYIVKTVKEEGGSEFRVMPGPINPVYQIQIIAAMTKNKGALLSYQ